MGQSHRKPIRLRNIGSRLFGLLRRWGDVLTQPLDQNNPTKKGKRQQKYFFSEGPLSREKETLVVNLSSRILNTAEEAVLSRGLGFVMTPVYKPFNTQIDLFKLIRMIKLRKFFGPSSIMREGPQVGPSKSRFTPNIMDPMITAFERLVQRDIASLEQQPQKYGYNLTALEKSAVESLKSDRSIIIKEADKGGAIVLLDWEIYITEINKQLDNKDFYQKITYDPGKQIQVLIQTVLVEATNLGYITEETAKSLTKQQYRTPVFYTLPKIHKPGSPPPPTPDYIRMWLSFRSIIKISWLLSPTLSYQDSLFFEGHSRFDPKDRRTNTIWWYSPPDIRYHSTIYEHNTHWGL